MIIHNSNKIGEKILIKVKSSLDSLIPDFYINNNLNLNTAEQASSILKKWHKQKRSRNFSMLICL